MTPELLKDLFDCFMTADSGCYNCVLNLFFEFLSRRPEYKDQAVAYLFKNQNQIFYKDPKTAEEILKLITE